MGPNLGELAITTLNWCRCFGTAAFSPRRFRDLLSRPRLLATPPAAVNFPTLVIMTCDTELMPPWRGGDWEHRSAEAFLDGVGFLDDLAKLMEIRFTFFVEGSAAQVFPQRVRQLVQDGHELGCHGYNHETYAGSLGTVGTPSLPHAPDHEGRQRSLELSLRILREATGTNALLFRAPFEYIDEDALSLLPSLGFRVDSSVHNPFHGLSSFPYHPRGGGPALWEIPATVDPLPTPWGSFRPISAWYPQSRDRALEAVARARSYDALLGHPFSVIVLTSHPWEFVKTPAPHFPTGAARGRALEDFLGGLAGLDGVRFASYANLLEYCVRAPGAG